MWLQAGKHKVGDEFNNMMCAKRAYKLELRKARQLATHKRCKYVESLMMQNDSKFWQKWKRVNTNTRTCANDLFWQKICCITLILNI